MKATILAALALTILSANAFAMSCTDGDTDLNLRSDKIGAKIRIKGVTYEVQSVKGLGDGTEDVYLREAKSASNEPSNFSINCEINAGE